MCSCLSVVCSRCECECEEAGKRCSFLLVLSSLGGLALGTLAYHTLKS